jgi:hypothetical protein
VFEVFPKDLPDLNFLLFSVGLTLRNTAIEPFVLMLLISVEKWFRMIHSMNVLSGAIGLPRHACRQFGAPSEVACHLDQPEVSVN